MATGTPHADLLDAGFLSCSQVSRQGCRYPWGQQPSAFVAAYRKVHDTLQSGTCGVDMTWSPNAAVGYPWRSGNASG